MTDKEKEVQEEKDMIVEMEQEINERIKSVRITSKRWKSRKKSKRLYC